MDTIRLYMPAIFLAPIGLVVALSILFWARLAASKARSILSARGSDGASPEWRLDFSQPVELDHKSSDLVSANISGSRAAIPQQR